MLHGNGVNIRLLGGSHGAASCAERCPLLWNLVGLAPMGHAILGQIFAGFGQRLNRAAGGDRNNSRFP